LTANRLLISINYHHVTVVICTPVASLTCTDLPDYWHSSRLRV